MKGYHFSKNEEVAHIDCPEVKMRVIDIKWRYHNKSTGESMEDPRRGFKKETVKRLEGIVCEWWEGKSLKVRKFHSSMLIPWVIAQKGQKAVEEWTQQMQ